VISWKYDPRVRNGMPAQETNQRMIALEDAIEDLEEAQLCRHAYSRTGNGLKEFVYYIADQGHFMEAFNDALTGHARYPIDITFFEDAAWEDFQKIRDLFTQE
jgi:hypothetical protein